MAVPLKFPLESTVMVKPPGLAHLPAALACETARAFATL